MYHRLKTPTWRASEIWAVIYVSFIVMYSGFSPCPNLCVSNKGLFVLQDDPTRTLLLFLSDSPSVSAPPAVLHELPCIEPHSTYCVFSGATDGGAVDCSTPAEYLETDLYLHRKECGFCSLIFDKAF